MSTCQSIRPVRTRIAAESRNSAVPSLRPTGSPSCLAGGEQVVLLHTVSCFRGAEQATKTFPAADTWPEAAASVSGATRHALEVETDDYFWCCFERHHNLLPYKAFLGFLSLYFLSDGFGP